MVELFTGLTEKDVDICLTVLAAAGIACQTSGHSNCFTLSVNDEDREIALFEIESYYRENKRLLHAPEYSMPPLDFTSGILAAIVVLAVHLAVIRYSGMTFFVKTFGASASSILDGEHYRVVTALMLHSGYPHLVGNMAGLILLAPLVCRRHGFGIGFLSILLSGAAGNYVNAHIYQNDHISIGASTSIFGAIGILVIHRFADALHVSGMRIRPWMPIASGLCLLGLLSSGEHTDILAHLFGFCCGMATGYGIHRVVKTPPGFFYQVFSFSVFLIIIFLSWTRLW